MLPPLPRCSRWAHSSLEIYPSVSAFPDSTFGSACTSTFSRIARRSLALRPAHSHGHQIRDRYPRASDISSPPCLPRLLPAGAVAGRGLHPLENAALSRRTWIPVIPDLFWPVVPMLSKRTFIHRRRRSRRGGGLSSFRLAHRQAQARQEQLAVLAVAKRHITGHDERGNGAQPRDDRPRFVEPPHMRIASGESAVGVGEPGPSWIAKSSFAAASSN